MIGLFAACVVAGTGNATAAGPPCWQQVIQEWTSGHVGDTYAPGCYREAVKHLPEDLRTYSSAPDDINRALLEAASRQSRSMSAAHPARGTLGSVSEDDGRSPPLAAILLGVLGAVVLGFCSLSAWLVVRRRPHR
jgi:hypothetical protein